MRPGIHLLNFVNKYSIESFTAAQNRATNAKKIVEDALAFASKSARKPLKTQEIKVFENSLPVWYDKEARDAIKCESQRSNSGKDWGVTKT